MSLRLPAISPLRMSRIVERLGFELHRQKGSHAFYRHPDGRSIAMHKKDIPKGTLKSMLKSLDLTEVEFKKLL